MSHADTPSIQPERLEIGGVAARIGVPALFIGMVALCIAVWGGFIVDGTAHPNLLHFYHSYMAAYTFFMAITLGSLAFVLIQHLTRAGWSVTVRRIAEGLSLNVFLMALLIFPLFIRFQEAGEPAALSGAERMLHWMDPEAADHDAILESKHGYLNPQFFAIRMGIYFAVWCLIAWFFASRSAKQDRDGSAATSVSLELWAKPAIIFFAFSMTAFIVDWVMSMNAHWFSTIFGVYYFAGCMLSALSAIVLIGQALQKRGLIGDAISGEHYHDLGKLMFAFTFFWGYIAFSQYMLIWYANMPEETQFYTPRQFGPWAAVSLTLLIVHLVIPFPGLLSRHVKRRNRVLSFWAVWSLCACALDIFWLVIPNQWITKIPATVTDNGHMLLTSALPNAADRYNVYEVTHPGLKTMVEFPLLPGSLLITALCFIGIGGLYIFSTMLALKGKPLVPTNDPRLNESLAFENI